MTETDVSVDRGYYFFMLRLSSEVWRVGVGQIRKPRISFDEYENHSIDRVIKAFMPYTNACELEQWVFEHYWKPPKIRYKKRNGKLCTEVVWIPDAVEVIDHENSVYDLNELLSRVRAITDVIEDRLIRR